MNLSMYPKELKNQTSPTRQSIPHRKIMYEHQNRTTTTTSNDTNMIDHYAFDIKVLKPPVVTVLDQWPSPLHRKSLLAAVMYCARRMLSRRFLYTMPPTTTIPATNSTPITIPAFLPPLIPSDFSPSSVACSGNS